MLEGIENKANTIQQNTSEAPQVRDASLAQHEEWSLPQIDVSQLPKAGGKVVALATFAGAEVSDEQVVDGVRCYSAAAPDEVAGRRVVCVMGAFDGLHLGHRDLVSAAVDDARRRGAACVAVTFQPDPAEVLEGVIPGSRLLDCQDRARGLVSLGVDYVLSFAFTKDEAATEYEDFLRLQLSGLVHPVAIHVGTNFRFGAGGLGTPSNLAQMGSRLGFAVVAHDLLQKDGQVVSATRIRGLLHEGRLGLANRLLSRCHFVRGTVQHGRGEGTSFGFPTANVVCDIRDCLPQEGVYACYVACDGHAWPAATNVGAPPSFSQPRPAFLEANLLGFDGDLYGREVQVVFVRWLRASRKFDSLEQLESAVMQNICWVKDNLGDARLEVSVDQ